ncbi:hypothetical protein [Shewanella surugensis]|uniref:Lipase modulator n=1 Tax=Shewanella surugensis TaxID=212020 RepID=A0ABT0LFM5_9GAMM|nr:hypothetical protein [Shewanella surugensis]MCL1126512.1 hypothetical protein [Shewanella surugensis]
MLYSNNKILIIAVSLCLLIALLLFLMSEQSGQAERDAVTSVQEWVKEQSKEQANQDDVTRFDTVATNWHWQRGDVQAEPLSLSYQNVAKLPFSAQSVFDALHAVKLDADANVVLDHDALVSLDETLERIHNKLDEDSLRMLLDLIHQSLPGQAGIQVAELVENYYYYLEAKEEFSQINEGLSIERDADPVVSIENDQVLYAELQALRDVHLGSDVSAELFRVSDANAQYMFASMKLDVNPNLTAQEHEQQRKDIQAQHIAQSVNIFDWPARYPAFLSAKQAITSASIDDQEKRRQVAALLSQHFTPEELTRIDYLNLSDI